MVTAARSLSLSDLLEPRSVFAFRDELRSLDRGCSYGEVSQPWNTPLAIWFAHNGIDSDVYTAVVRCRGEQWDLAEWMVHFNIELAARTITNEVTVGDCLNALDAFMSAE